MKTLARLALIAIFGLGSANFARSQQNDVVEFLTSEVFEVEFRENTAQSPALALAKLGVTLSPTQNVPGNGPPLLFTRFLAARDFVDLKESMVISTIPKPGAWEHSVHFGIAKNAKCVAPVEIARSTRCKAARPHFVEPITMPGMPRATSSTQDGVVCAASSVSKRDIVFYAPGMSCVRKVVLSLP
jgi:hypothetical protein